MDKGFTFRDIEKDILEPCCKEFANVAYEVKDESVIVFTCDSGRPNLDSGNVQRFLCAVLCKSLYDSVFGLAETEEAKKQRSSFFRGKKNAKSSSTVNLVKNANERFDPLCNEQLHRVHCLLETTALVQAMSITKDKTKVKLSKLKEEVPEAVQKGNLKELKKGLVENLNKSEIKRFFSNEVTVDNIEEALTKIVLLATFRNDYINYKQDVETIIIEKICALFMPREAVEEKVSESDVEKQYGKEIEHYTEICKNGLKYFDEKNYDLAMSCFNNYQAEAEALYNVTRDKKIFDSVVRARKNIICVLLKLKMNESAIEKYDELLNWKLALYMSKKEFIDFYSGVLSKVKEYCSICTYENGDIYHGELKEVLVNDMPKMLAHGYGTFYWFDGQAYVGEYREGKRNGLGVFFFQDKVYCGGWKNDQFDGPATWIFCDGSVLRTKYSEGVELQ